MTKPMIRIHNTETNEIVDREMTDEEFAQFNADIKDAEEKAAKAKTAAEEKLQLLQKLGITEDEAKLLLA